MYAKILFGISNLEGNINQYYDTQDNFCKKASMSKATLNNKTYFSLENIRLISKLLNIFNNEVGSIFLKRKFNDLKKLIIKQNII